MNILKYLNISTLDKYDFESPGLSNFYPSNIPRRNIIDRPFYNMVYRRKQVRPYIFFNQ